ncbi:MAG: ROK family transcriptional regulator [Lachnospiraceae bacterium]|jgi:predicted NBD/HSP70 family sugar kinase|nr:ROK family transcriptional regulator [Lachnospiraceae bacterium]
MGNIKELKKQNLMETLAVIHEKGEMTKQEVARQTGMSAVSAHSFINELLDKGMLMSGRTEQGNQGRRATLYKLNPYYGFVVGQSLSPAAITTVSYDFACGEISAFSLEIGKLGHGELGEAVRQQAAFAIGNHEKSHRRCLGLGFAVPGPMDSKTQVIRKAMPFIDVNPMELKAQMEEAFSVPVFMGNDNKFNALAIKLMENRRCRDPLVFVGVREGVGAGVLVEGKILKGANYLASEVGHIPIQMDGEVCSCGQRGCLETFIGEKYLIGRIVRHLNENPASGSASGAALYTHQDITMKHVLAMAEDDAFVKGQLEDACRYLAICLENIVKAYNPEEIVLECKYLESLPGYFRKVQDLFFASPWVRGNEPTLRLNTIPNVWAVGAATAVLDNVFTPAPENILGGALEC